ncbi:hypothetical protein PR202_gb15901 [Eleusine coracana subsp. coracana]|uniref:14-3-3 domain-containing protein n=1 Tax=Eleusine coracana subsp. coracana TaxID=191504 RepID=A0AAV5EZ08_ELECO|nr:hypothetical protein PR202_gb15901 [Eleusine coracana subsp. coracana]
MESRLDLTFRASLAEKAERYEDMMDAMNNIATLNLWLTVKERELLSMSYQKVATAKLKSLHALTYAELEAQDEGNERHMKMTIEFRHKVENELDRLCYKVIDTIDKHLLPKGDYYRYLAEFKTEPENSRVIDHSLKAYENASNIAEKNMSPAHPVRLGVALNISIFYFEMLNSTERACQHAKQAFEDALPNLELIGEQLYNKSSSILQLLMKNLAFWNLNSNMDVDAEHTQDATGRSDASVDSNMDVGADYTSEHKGESGTSVDTTTCDGDAK